MDTSDINDVVVKKEPSDNSNGTPEENGNENQVNAADATPPSIQGPLRYVSRRGRPPGGGYSMKSHAHYASFNAMPLSTNNLSRQLSNGSSSSLSPHDILKSGGSASADNLDIRRFGFQGFDRDKNSFRCDGCDVIFSSRDTYAMHMLLRAKNESCVALPTSAISSNPENPTPREKFERELRQHTMLTALRNQATVMSKTANSVLNKPSTHSDSFTSLTQSASLGRDEAGLTGACGAEGVINVNNLFSVETFGLYVDPHHYRRVLDEYRASVSTGSLQTMMEQQSCKECGEIFTSKDALAMHMMFHTRDGEKEATTNDAWADKRSKSSQKPVSHFSSASSSPTQCNSSRKLANIESISAPKREASKTEGRELTAERVAELKQMAIESSLRSHLKRSTISKQSTRPKSVSQDVNKTTSTQDRPLSADDVRRFTTSEPHGDQDIPESISFSKNAEDQSATRFCRRKRHSTLEHGNSFEVKRMSVDTSKRKRNKYESIFYNLFGISNKKIDPSADVEIMRDSKVRDRDLLFTTGPQDSDDRSESSSATENESNIDRAEQATDYSKSRTVPFLDAIMSDDAVLVPLDPTINKDDSDRTVEEEKTTSVDNIQKTQSSALDFSIGCRERRQSMNRSSWYTPQKNHNKTNLENQLFSTGSQLSSAANLKTDRNAHLRNRVFNYDSFDFNTSAQTTKRGHRAESRLSSVARQRVSVSNSSQENDGPSRNYLEESTSRLGEARYCPHCEILFLDVTLFHLHMGLHNVNNPWQCNTCGLVCSGRLDFSTHVLHY